MITKEVMSMDCGGETFANVSQDMRATTKFSGTVGRVSVSKEGSDGSNKARVRVGPFDMKE